MWVLPSSSGSRVLTHRGSCPLGLCLRGTWLEESHAVAHRGSVPLVVWLLLQRGGLLLLVVLLLLLVIPLLHLPVVLLLCLLVVPIPKGLPLVALVGCIFSWLFQKPS